MTKVKVIQRDCSEADFDKSKISTAILKAMKNGSGIVKPKIAEDIADEIEEECKDKDEVSVSDIESMVYDKLITKKQRLTAKAYEGYRSIREFQRENENTTDSEIDELLDGESEYWNTENSNKNSKVLNTQRDYMAGIVSKDISRRFLLPPEVVQAHDEGIIHFHDIDYFGMNAMSNCSLINLEDMLQNGTCINNAQQPTGAGDLQPRPPPRVCKAAAHDQAAQHVHRARAEATEEDKGEAVRAVLNEIADIFEGGEGEGDRYCRSLDSIPLRLKHQQIKHQRQQLHHFLHHRRDLRRGGKGVRLTYCREEGVDISRKQAHPHPGNAEQEEAELPPAHAQSGHQQRGHHAQKDVFDVGHAATAFLVAGSSPNMARVSSRSHQKAGLSREVSGQKQPAVQSRYSANAKQITPMWKYRIFRAAPVCPLA